MQLKRDNRDSFKTMQGNTVARTCNSQNNCSVQIHLLRYAIRIEIRLNAKQICSQCETNLFSMQNKMGFNAKQICSQCKINLFSMQNQFDPNAKSICSQMQNKIDRKPKS